MEQHASGEADGGDERVDAAPTAPAPVHPDEVVDPLARALDEEAAGT